MNNIDFLVESLLKTDAFKLDSQFGYSMRPRKLTEVECADLLKERLNVLRDIFKVSNNHHDLAIAIHNSINDTNQRMWFFDSLIKASKLNGDFLPKEAKQKIDDACLSIRLGQDLSKPNIQIKFEELNIDDIELTHHFDMSREFINSNVMDSIIDEFEVATLLDNQKRMDVLLSITKSDTSQQLYSKIISYKESVGVSNEDIGNWASNFELERLQVTDVPKTLESLNLEQGALLPKDFHISQHTSIDTSKRMAELYNEHQFRTVITQRNVIGVAARDAKTSLKNKLGSFFAKNNSNDKADEDWDLEGTQFSDLNPSQSDELDHDRVKSISFVGNDGATLFESKIDSNRIASVHLSKGTLCNEVVAEMMVLQYIKINGLSPMDVNPPKNQNKNGAKAFIENVVIAALNAGIDPNDITITPTEHFNGEELAILKNQIEAKFNKLNFDNGGLQSSDELPDKLEDIHKQTNENKLDDSPEPTDPDRPNQIQPVVKIGKVM